MGKLNLKLGCLVYPCFSCSTFLFTESHYIKICLLYSVFNTSSKSRKIIFFIHIFWGLERFTNPKRVLHGMSP